MQGVLAPLLAAALTVAAASGTGDADASSGARPSAPTVNSGSAAAVPLRLAASHETGGSEQLATGEMATGEVPQSIGDTMLGVIPGEVIPDLVEGALPPPPNIVVRETRYFGTVTIDHRAHLARRVQCKLCHGPGQITKLKFTPKVAHERCIGCHQQVAKGPVKCQGCHVRPPPPPVEVASAEEEAAKPAAPPGPDPANVASALDAVDRNVDSEIADPFRRHIEFGFAAGSGEGASVQLTTHQSLWVFTQGIDEIRAPSFGRTIVLLGAGVCRALNPDTLLSTSAVGGLDAFDRPVVAMFPAFGVRGALEFRQPARFVQKFSVSLTALTDTARHSFGREIGGVVVYGGISTGFKLP